MVAKAATLPADEVILDLEDAVSRDPQEKALARTALIALVEAVDFGHRTLAVRINQVGTPDALRDLAELIPKVGHKLDCIVVPKVSRTSEVGFVEHCLDALEADPESKLGLEIQIEDPMGLESVAQLASSSQRLEALIFGPGDFAAAMGMPQTVIGGQAEGYPGDIWHYPLWQIAVAARARGLQVIDGPYSAISDSIGLEMACSRAAALGVDGKWVIHPSQLGIVNEKMAASAGQVARARRVLEELAETGGAKRLDGEMVDEASRKMAEAVLARAGEQL